VVPARFAAASLVVVNKCDRLPEAGRERTLARIEQRGYVVNLVGRSIHIASAAAANADSELVAIGLHLDAGTARTRLEHALEPAGTANAAGYRRLQHYRRLSY
jgi:G3E family GTPase